LFFENAEKMSSLLAKLLWIGAAVSMLLIQSSQAGQQISKCRDAKGVWHYGGFAAQECENSKVRRIDSSGVRLTDEIGPTAAEKKRKLQQLELLNKLRKRQLEQQKKDQQLFRLYDSEQAVIQERNKHLRAIDNEVSSNRSLSSALKRERKSLLDRLAGTRNSQEKQRLESLLTAYNQQLVAYQRVAQEILQRRERVKSKYDDDLNEYRDLLQRQANQPGPAIQ